MKYLLKNDECYKIKVYIYFILLFVLIFLGTIIFYNIEKDKEKKVYEKYGDKCMKEKLNVHKNIKKELMKEKERLFTGDKSKKYFKDALVNLFEEIDTCHRVNEDVKINDVDSYQVVSYLLSISSTIGNKSINHVTNYGCIFFIVFSLISIPIFVSMIVEIYENLINYQKKIQLNKRKEIIKYRFSVSITILILLTLTLLLIKYLETTIENKKFSPIDVIKNTYEIFSKIGYGYIIPERNLKFIFIEVPVLFLGIIFYSLYVDTMVQLIRHDFPKCLYKRIGRRRNVIKYLIKSDVKEDFGIMKDYREMK
uniref:Ion_trans_2 domain-containing protein n=1 Tax=Parastrongyloides trichosuri TaxID=131310 RepID=A0A0N4ZJ25_PARTI